MQPVVAANDEGPEHEMVDCVRAVAEHGISAAVRVERWIRAASP